MKAGETMGYLITLGERKIVLALVALLPISSHKLVEETSVFLCIYTTSWFVNVNNISPEGDATLLKIQSSSRLHELATAVR
jgi:hypothetical protein